MHTNHFTVLNQSGALVFPPVAIRAAVMAKLASRPVIAIYIVGIQSTTPWAFLICRHRIDSTSATLTERRGNASEIFCMD